MTPVERAQPTTSGGTNTYVLTETEEYRVRADTPEEAEEKYLADENGPDVEWIGVTARTVEDS